MIHSISIIAVHANGRSGCAVVMGAEVPHTGPDHVTPIGPLDAARLEGDRLMRDCGYAGIDVEVTAYCDGCGGSGKVRNKRRRALYATKHCPICKGRNSVVTIVPRMRVLG